MATQDQIGMCVIKFPDTNYAPEKYLVYQILLYHQNRSSINVIKGEKLQLNNI